MNPAKSTKGHIAEATAALASVPEVRARFLAEQARQERGKLVVQAGARQLEEQSRKLGDESEAKLRPHERLAMALSFIQIAVALAAITVLTRRRWQSPPAPAGGRGAGQSMAAKKQDSGYG